MKIFLQLVSCFVALHAATLADPTLMDWQEFKVKFGKTYKTPEEEQYRMKTFMETRTSIAEHNAKYERGEVTYEMGINKFSDIRTDEFTKLYTGLKYLETPARTTKTVVSFPDDLSVPYIVNWVEKGAVTPVKNQGDCLSDYAFSATGSMEGQHFLKTGTLVPLSVQNALDCTSKFGNFGCFGGIAEYVYEYVIANGGIDTEASYPYEVKLSHCRFKNETIGAKISSYQYLPIADEDALEKAVATIGPISVVVDATNFKSYKSGIFSDPKCSIDNLTLAVLVVGYGADNATQQPYWLIKNCWGTDWGEQGYMRLAKDDRNMCGVATVPIYPIV